MKRMILPVSALALSLAASTAFAGPDVNINISGFVPPPPGVHVLVDGGRPYYRDNGRVVYLEREDGPGRRGRGHAYGHRKHKGDRGWHGEHRGHGRGHGHGHE